MPDEKNLLVCAKIGQGTPVRGADISECSGCHTPVWVSPTSIRAIQEGTCEPFCEECALPKIMADPKSHHVGFLPGQLKEILENLH